MYEISKHLQRLNLATRQYHADVDRPWLRLLLPSVSKADYLAVLVRMYGFIAPCEGAARFTPHLDRVLDMHTLTRAGLIAQDLLALGLTPLQVATVPHCSAIAAFDTPAEALGWLYVVERTTLLHDGIRRHLVAQMPVLERATSYLQAHDGASWTAFGRTLDAVETDDVHVHTLVASAERGFQALDAWFRSGTDSRRHTG